MSKAEQLTQNEIYSQNLTILDKYECYSLGAVTIKNLMETKIIKEHKIKKTFEKKKPDVLIVDKDNNVVVYIEQKTPNKLKNEKDLQTAIRQEIEVAKEVQAKIYIVSDGDSYFWINPLTENIIKDENGNNLNFQIKPKENSKETVELLERVLLSISEENDQILKKNFLDPTDLAEKINRLLVNLTFASPKNALYTFIELFLFKYLSDIKILTEENSFSHIVNMYKKHSKDLQNSGTITDAKVLGIYLEKARETMKKLFPTGDDGTSIINGQIFHIEKDSKNNYKSVIEGQEIIFKKLILAFEKYENENGKFIHINSDFKSKLFETFMKKVKDKDKMGQFFTPLKAVKEMVRMVDIKEGMSICDPACGVGKFLLESVENKLMKYYDYSNKKIKKNIEIIGFDKMMTGNSKESQDDLTIILAKANMLIHFSELFTKNNSFEDVQNLANSLLNKTFVLKKSTLGTLESLEENKYDLILASTILQKCFNERRSKKNRYV